MATTRDLSAIHADVVRALTALADATDAVFDAADTAAAVAEKDPQLAGYLQALMPLMSLTVPNVPPSPNV